MEKKEFTIYMAGLIDGEGTLLINKHKFSNPNFNPRYAPFVRINMCDLKPLELAQSIWGGSIHHNLISLKNPNWRDTFMWQTSCKLAYSFLDDIYPYLIVKKSQADILYKLREVKKNKTIKTFSGKAGCNRFFSDKVVKELENLFQLIKLEKRKSVNQ